MIQMFYVVAAGASTYTQIDTGVMCKPTSEEEIGCDNLKAFIVSSGLGGSADADAVSMVTGRCPLDGTPSNPSSCWVDVSVDEDGNVRTIPLPLGYNLIDWVAADKHGNLPRNNAKPSPQVIKRTQLIYAAPVVVLNGVTDLILLEVGSTGTGSFIVQFGQGGDTISFIGGTSRSLPTPLSFDCTPAASFTPPLESAGVYTYTATDAGTCSFVGLTSTSSVTFADASSLDPLFYFAGNEITVESTSTGGDVAPMRIDEIVVTSVNSITPISAVTFETTYTYSVTVVPSGSAVVEITPMAINDSGDDFTIGDPIELNNNGFMVPRRNYLENQLELLPLKPEITVDDLYLSIKAAIVGSSIDRQNIYYSHSGISYFACW